MLAEAFVSIYSAKRNFGRRLALRDTWLPLLKTHGIPYRFFLAGTAVDDTELDSLLRRERDYFDDMVFLVGTTDEYPIGKKGLAALLWVAHHSDAQFWLKFDDDLYVRPQLVLSRLAGIQRAELYWGAFDYSGMVIRDASDPHYTPPEIWPEPVFPPYARGAALAMSMDLVRLIAHQEEHRPLKKIKAEETEFDRSTCRCLKNSSWELMRDGRTHCCFESKTGAIEIVERTFQTLFRRTKLKNL